MSDYPLAPLAEFLEYDGEIAGAVIRCPNCGVSGSVWFVNSIPSGRNLRPEGPTWQRTGDTFETMSLLPSIRMNDHYHGFVRSGMLAVDSPFWCTNMKGDPVAKKSYEAEETPVSEKTLSANPKEQLTAIAKEVEMIGRLIPTPNVTDSHAHGKSLQILATRIRSVAAEL